MIENLRKQKYFYLVLIFFLFLNIQGQSPSAGKEEQAQKSGREKWAVKMKVPGIKNFYVVSCKILYRGAQPKKEGIRELQKMGITTIVNLRHSNRDAKWVKGTKLKYYHLSTSAGKPDKKKFQRFMEIVADTANHPIFVHCKHGADRTGVAVALYRIKIENWTVDDALEEMVHGPYGFHKIYGNLKRFVKNFFQAPLS